MSDGITTRKLVRQEWKPLAGSRIVRFVAMPGGQSVPSMAWTDGDLPGGSEIVNEVVGYAELPARARFPAVPEFEAFVLKVQEVGEMVNWVNEWEEKAATVERSDEVDEEMSAQEVRVALDDEVLEAADELVDEMEQMGEPEDEEEPEGSDDDEPADGGDDPDLPLLEDPSEYATPSGETADGETIWQLTDGASDRNAADAVYRGVVNNVEPYGAFVSLNAGFDEVTGLLHVSKLREDLATVADFTAGDVVAVTVDNRTEKGLELGFEEWVNHQEPDSGLDELFNQ